ncbi:hypothetical protein [Saccharopolyspora phatthalungensis]|uniref:Uncharacterized protein n=1 Tax=Saccharopolyspora phatthalungensis TaxID=664693 RepID=A0A840QHZ4_9PSEU|nr:hypothetical protein [Saccharopolyspora phatthalungensis]MBB5158438.1 hypothetical protein [Saccharopolyspora phatthalungensis]
MEPSSVDGSSHLLAELAGLLEEGRLDSDNATAAKAPRAHPDVGVKVEEFSRFAHDQYQDLVALLGALATKLKATCQHVVSLDGHQHHQRILRLGRGAGYGRSELASPDPVETFHCGISFADGSRNLSRGAHLAVLLG